MNPVAQKRDVRNRFSGLITHIVRGTVMAQVDAASSLPLGGSAFRSHPDACQVLRVSWSLICRRSSSSCPRPCRRRHGVPAVRVEPGFDRGDAVRAQDATRSGGRSPHLAQARGWSATG